MYLNTSRVVFSRLYLILGGGKINLVAKHKVWLELEGKPLIGKGRYELLKSIAATNSLKMSAKQNNISYKTAFNYIKKIENRAGEKIVVSKRGGKSAGGSVSLTDYGIMLLNRYTDLEKRYPDNAE
jgi:molybdate transport system regulatory protein